MGRWSPDARERLEQAALELFVEQGFAATTVPQITARAGLTTRTFFRHFADKREVFFAGDEIPALARRLLAEAPPGLDPVVLLERGLRQVATERFDGRRAEIGRRREVITHEPALTERDAQKRAELVRVIGPGLVARGVDPLDAALLAELTVLVLHVALDVWLDGAEDHSLADVVTACFARLRTVLDPSASPEAGRRRGDGEPSV